SYFGIPIGGAFLTFLILGAYIKQKTASTGPKELIWLIVLCSITAFTAMLVRGGPEAFKALIVEAIIIPVVIFFGAILFTRISSMITAKVKGNSTVISENKE
ncbi:MAG: hypothetical protein QNL29_08630, partial [Crocinitomicaceae bacterium]